jgi:hypothetical protein
MVPGATTKSLLVKNLCRIGPRGVAEEDECVNCGTLNQIKICQLKQEKWKNGEVEKNLFLCSNFFPKLRTVYTSRFTVQFCIAF